MKVILGEGEIAEMIAAVICRRIPGIPKEDMEVRFMVEESKDTQTFDVSVEVEFPDHD